MHTTNIHYVTSLAYLLMLSQSQGGHFWRGRPARLRLCVQNKCTPVHTPLRGWSDSEIMAGERREGEGKQKVEEEECENSNGQQAHKISSDSLPPPGLAEIHR